MTTRLAFLAPDRSHDPVLQTLAASVGLYCVGGAVRDALMGLASVDRDYLVVGGTPEMLVASGFRPVGNDFPVFLHPDTHAEYALARTERKSAPGYKGFVFHASPSVTLEEDLARRDLTINAMAVDAQGVLHDPFGGQQDIAARTLRHVSPAFSEDPVRLLRLARFLARWPDFQVAPETVDLCRAMVRQGEVQALVPERIVQELWRGLQSTAPAAMIAFLGMLDCYTDITGRPMPAAEDLAMLTRLRTAALPTPLIAGWLWGVDKLPLPKEVAQWAAVIGRGSGAPPLSLPIAQWPQALVGWAEAADLFRHPDRLEPLLRFGMLATAQAPSPTSQSHHEKWAGLAHALLRYPVGPAAQAAASGGKPIAEAVRTARETFIAEALQGV